MSEIWTVITIGLAQALAIISPGPSFLITAQTAVGRSRKDGLKVAFGLAVGTLICSTAALLGLNVLFHAVPVVFLAMKVFGALFLLWIAYKTFIHAPEPLDVTGQVGQGGSSLVKGFLVQIGNPKVAVFFGSIFVSMLPASIPLWMAVTIIAMVTFNEMWWYSLVALFFGAAPVRSFYLRAKTGLDRAVGLFLGAVGAKLLWAAWAGD